MRQLLDLKNQGRYLKLLKPPSGLAYRFVGGLTPKEASERYLNRLPVKDIISEPGVAFYAEPIGVVEDPAFKSTYMPKSKLSSWTIAPTKPEFGNFAISNPGKVSVVLVADIDSNNFIMNPKQLEKNLSNKFYALPINTIITEQEVIAYGPVDCLEAAAIFVGKPVLSYDERDRIYQSIPPVIFNTNRQGALIKPAAFSQALDYVNALLNKYKDKMSSKAYSNFIKKDVHYRLLSKYAKEGIVCDGTYGQKYQAIGLGRSCVSTITQAVLINTSLLYGEDIQKQLLKALNLKIKKR